MHRVYINPQKLDPIDAQTLHYLVHFKKKKKKSDQWHVRCDMWHVTHDIWHMTFDTWHLTHDIWHMTFDTWHLTHDIWHMIFDMSDVLCDEMVWDVRCNRKFSVFLMEYLQFVCRGQEIYIPIPLTLSQIYYDHHWKKNYFFSHSISKGKHQHARM